MGCTESTTNGDHIYSDDELADIVKTRPHLRDVAASYARERNDMLKIHPEWANSTTFSKWCEGMRVEKTIMSVR